MARGIVEFNSGLLFNSDLPATSQTIADWDDGQRLKQTNNLARNPAPRGVFSEFPSATPKWLGKLNGAQVDFRDTMARMFILLDANERERFLASVDNSHRGHGMSDQGESKILASVLAGRGKDEGKGYIDFLLQQADHPFEEKAQITETLADNFVIYYFGAAAVPFTYSGTVFNTFEDDQAINMLRIYRDMIRGTQLARRRKLLRLRYNGMIVAGSVMGLHLGLSADPETSMSFSLRLMPKSIQLLPNPDFGVVQVHDRVGIDPYFLKTKDEPTNVRGARPIGAPANILTQSTAATVPEDESEDEAGTR